MNDDRILKMCREAGLSSMQMKICDKPTEGNKK